MSAGLELKDVTIRFGGLKAVSELSFDVAPGELVGLIGPNGAGKTTVFNLITGVYTPTSGPPPARSISKARRSPARSRTRSPAWASHGLSKTSGSSRRSVCSITCAPQ
jgi:ABC-type branched-subunit amino acid transport system ATPase component